MLIDQIQYSIYMLGQKHCKEEDIKITFSEKVNEIIKKEIIEIYGYSYFNNDTLFGVKVERDFPLNEIWVYSKKACYDSDLLIKIEVL